MTARGIGNGDIVLIWLANEPAWMEIFLACGRVGAIAFAVNTRFRAADLADILARTQARAIVYRQRFLNIRFDELIDDAADRSGWRPPLEIVIGPDQPTRALSLEMLAAAGAEGGGSVSADMGEPSVDADTGVVLFTTSGTTSRPKYVLHSQGSIVRHARDVAAGFEMTAPDAIMLQALPYNGVFGFCQAMGALAAHRPSVVMESFEAALANRLIADHAVTHFNATDDMLAMMADADPTTTTRRSLRLVGAASFNRGPDTLARLARECALPVVGLYGMSEVQALFARRSLDDPPELRFLAGGRPVAGTGAVRVRDPDTGGLVPGSAERGGELEVTGPSAFSAYFGDTEATAETILEDGFVRTGDFGAINRGAGFTFISRMGDTLRLGGYLVNPAEIAAFVTALPGVADCQVVGVNVDERMQTVAFVIAEDGAVLDPEGILIACRADLAKFKVPALVHELTDFPAVDSPNGVKVQRGELRRLAQGLLTQST